MQVGLYCIKMLVDHDHELERKQASTVLCGPCLGFLSWVSILSSLNDGLWPRSIKWDKPFPPPVASYYGICHSNRRKLGQSYSSICLWRTTLPQWHLLKVSTGVRPIWEVPKARVYMMHPKFQTLQASFCFVKTKHLYSSASFSRMEWEPGRWMVGYLNKAPGTAQTQHLWVFFLSLPCSLSLSNDRIRAGWDETDTLLRHTVQMHASYLLCIVCKTLKTVFPVLGTVLTL